MLTSGYMEYIAIYTCICVWYIHVTYIVDKLYYTKTEHQKK